MLSRKENARFQVNSRHAFYILMDQTQKTLYE